MHRFGNRQLQFKSKGVYATCLLKKKGSRHCNYSQFNLEPKGQYTISVCMGTACYVKGSRKVLDKLEEVLGIQAGHTTPDGLFTLNATRCLGACGLAPVMMINEDVYGRLTPDEIPGIIAKYRS